MRFMRGENLKGLDVVSLCLHFKVVGKVYKVAMFWNSYHLFPYD